MKINIIFTILWTLALILFTVIILLIMFPYIDTSTYITLKPDEKEKAIKHLTTLLVPLGVLISAALASTSVMKSIHNTNKIEKKKDEEKVINAEKYIDTIITSVVFSYNMLYATYKSISFNNELNLSKLMEDYPDPSLIAFAGDFPSTNINTFVLKELDEISMSFQDIKCKLEDKDLIYYLNKDDNKIFDFTMILSRLIREINFCKEKYNAISFGSDNEISQSIEYMKCLYLLIKFAK